MVEKVQNQQLMNWTMFATCNVWGWCKFPIANDVKQRRFTVC